MNVETIKLLLVEYFEAEGWTVEVDHKTKNITAMSFFDHPNMPASIDISELARFIANGIK